MKSRPLGWVLVCALSGTAACASYRNGPGYHGNWPLEGGSRKAVAVVVAGQVADVEPVLRAYRESELFRSVDTKFGDADIRVEVFIRSHSAFGPVRSVVGFVNWAATCLTVFAFPFFGEDVVTMESRVADSRGKPLGTFTKSERISTIVQLALVVAAPTALIAQNAALFDLTRATIAEARAREVF
jgi:hypothetical protein